MYMKPYQGPADQAWLGLWVSLYGADSKLARYLDKRPQGRVYDRLPSPGARPRARGETRQPRQAKVETASSFPVPPGENIAPLDRRSLRRLLENAPYYFAAVNALRTTSPVDYELFRQIGCAIPAYEDTSLYRISIDPKDALPAFAAGIWLGKHWGGKCWEGHEAERDSYARIAIFKRVVMPTGAYVPFGDVIYEWIDIWANHVKGTSGGCAAYLGVERATGRVRVLAQPTVTNQRLPSGKVISHAKVGVPSWVRLMHQDWLADLEPDARPHLRSLTIHQWAGDLLGIALAETRAVDAAWQVHLSKDKAQMRICVPQRSAKLFFADREAEEEGVRRRPIFHIVSEHARALGGNRTTTVREHYRGNRQFDWSGYRVLITVPGHHHGKLSEFATDAYDEAIVPRNRLTIDLPSAARRFAAYIWRSSKFHSYRRGW